jgi:hypothetical protein
MPQMYVIIYHNNKNKKKSQFTEDLVSTFCKVKSIQSILTFLAKRK